MTPQRGKSEKGRVKREAWGCGPPYLLSPISYLYSVSPRQRGRPSRALPGGHLFLFHDRSLFLYLFLFLYHPLGCTERYNTSGGRSRRVLPRRSRLRAAYFLRAEKVPKDALRGARAGWDLRLRCAPGGDPYAPPPPRPPPFTGANTRTLALAAGAQDLAAVRLLRRPLRPDPADEKPSALVRRRLGVGVDCVGR